MRHLIHSVLLLTTLLITKTSYSQSDSLRANLKSAIEGEDILEISQAFNALETSLLDQYKYDSAKTISNKFLGFVKSKYGLDNRDSLLTEIYLRIGREWNSKGNIEGNGLALAYADSVILLADKNEITFNSIRGRILKSESLNLLGDYNASMNTGLSALEIIDEANEAQLRDLYSQSILMQIAESFFKLGQTEQAIDYIKKALKQNSEGSGYLTDKFKVNLRMHEFTKLSTFYFQIDSLDRSLEYAELGEKLASELGDFQMEMANLNMITSVQKRKGEYEASLEGYDKLLNLSEQNDHKSGVMAAYTNMAESLAYLDRLEEALEVTKKAAKIAKGFDPYYLRNIEGNLAYTYELMGDFENAYHHQVRYKEMQDSLVQANNLKSMNDLLLRYETAEKEKQLAEQELEIQTTNATLSERNTQITLLVSGLGLILLGGTLFYNRNKAKQKQQIQAAIIDEKERGLEAIVQATEEERKRISKDLHDGIGQQLNALKLGLKTVEKEVEGELKEKVCQISSSFSRSADEVRQISHQMMPRALMADGLVKAVEDLLRNIFQYTEIAHDFEHHKMEERLDEKVEVSMYRILQELLSNIIKHSEATKVQVQLIRLKGKVTLLVEDNGKGFNGANNDGHGQMNIRNRLDMIKGTVNYEPSPESGVVAVVTVPID